MFAGAVAGRVGQNVALHSSTFYPNCSGHEANISQCERESGPGEAECRQSVGRVAVSCYVDDPVSEMGTSCDLFNATAAPGPGENLPTVTTTVVSPSHSTTGSDPTDDISPDFSSSGTTDVPVSSSGGGPALSTSFSPTVVIAVAVGLVALIFVAVIVIGILIAALCLKRTSHRKRNNFNDQVCPDSPVKVRNADQADRYKDLEPGSYTELNNGTVIQHQVPVYDTVKNKSQHLSEVSASDSNDDVDNHTYAALDPEAIYTQIPPHLNLSPGISRTLPIGTKDVPPSMFYQKLDRSLSLPRSTGSGNSATGPEYMLTHAVNRTALEFESGNVSESDLASPRSGASIKYPSPRGSPKQHRSSSQSSPIKEDLSVVRKVTNDQTENYYYVLDQGVPTTTAATAAVTNTIANSDIDSQVSTDAVCNQQMLENYADNRHHPHRHSPRRQRQRVVAPDEMTMAEGGNQQHLYAVLEPSVRSQLTPPFRHETKPRTQSTLNNRSPPRQQRVHSNTSKGDVNYSASRVIKNNFNQLSLDPDVTNTLV